MLDSPIAPEIVKPPDDAKFIHGSSETRWFTNAEGVKPDYVSINVGDQLQILNINHLADMVPDEVNTIDVHDAPARGLPMFTNGTLGADMLYVPPGESFPLHVHPGHHFLYCVRGKGSVTFAGQIFIVVPGDLYMIEASIPHAVGAAKDGEGHWLISFGAPHTRVDSEDRMTSLEV